MLTQSYRRFLRVKSFPGHVSPSWNSIHMIHGTSHMFSSSTTSPTIDHKSEILSSNQLLMMLVNASNQEKLSLYDKTKKENPQLINIDVIHAILKSSLLTQDIQQSKRIFHEDIQQFNIDPSTLAYGLMIQTYCSVSDLKNAYLLLDEMIQKKGLEPDSSIFLNLISSESKNKNWRKTIELLDIMNQSKSLHKMNGRCSLICLNTAISACGKASQQHKAIELLRLARNGHYKMKPNLSTYHAAMSSCIPSKDYKMMLKLFGEMREDGFLPTIETFQIALNICDQGKQPQAALGLFKLMKEYELKPTLFCYNAVISSMTKDNYPDSVVDLLEEMDQQQVIPTVVTYSAAILCCVVASNHNLAIHFFNEMKNKYNITPNTYSYYAILSVLIGNGSKNNNHELAMTFFRMSQIESSDNVFIYNVILNSCAKTNKSKVAWSIFNEMKNNNIIPNIKTFTIMVNLCEKMKTTDKIIDLEVKMKAYRVRPDIRFINSMMQAYAMNMKYKLASILLDTMYLKYGIKPDINSYNYLLKAYSLAGDYEKANEILSTLEKNEEEQENGDVVTTPSSRLQNVQPNHYSYGHVLLACTHKPGYLTQSFQIIERMKKNLTKNGSYFKMDLFLYHTLLKICALNHGTSESINLLLEMETSRYLKPTIISFHHVLNSFVISEEEKSDAGGDGDVGGDGGGKGGDIQSKHWKWDALAYINACDQANTIPDVEMFVTTLMQCKDNPHMKWDLKYSAK